MPSLSKGPDGGRVADSMRGPGRPGLRAPPHLELLLDDSRRVHAKIVGGGGRSRLEIFDGVFHCWQMLDRVIPEARAALRQAADFIESPAT